MTQFEIILSYFKLSSLSFGFLVDYTTSLLNLVLFSSMRAGLGALVLSILRIVFSILLQVLK